MISKQGRLPHIHTFALCFALAACADPGVRGGTGDDPFGAADPMIPRFLPDKPVRTVILSGYSQSKMHVKFHEGTQVRLRQGSWVTLGSDDVRGLTGVVARYAGSKIERLITRPEEEVTRDKARIEAKSDREQADMNLYYRLTVAPGVRAEDVIDDLNALDIVEIAYPEPLPAPPPMFPSTSDYSGDQGYLDSAPDGVDAGFASRVCGGRGGAVKIIDVERDWNDTHEDLAAANGQLIPNGTPTSPFGPNHGTAVLGEMVGSDNGFGVTGIVFNSAVAMVNTDNTDGYQLADAIDLARMNLTDGDLMILEVQTAGANGGCNLMSQVGCVAVEWVQAWYDEIVAATSDGIIVLEAAGNGSEDIGNTADYGDPFPDGRADSGAIIVGAGRAPGGTDPARGRLGFSTFGPRVNLQGWGNAVVTTGYGDLQGGPDPDAWYTDTFSGTSSATPIVTGAAAALSSVSQTLAGVAPTSVQVRSRLISTGTPQDVSTDTGHIGPLPDLAQALLGYDTDAPDIMCPADFVEECESHSGNSVDYSVPVSDNCDVEAVADCSPTSGSTFTLGTMMVDCSTSDASGNDAACDFEVTIQDTTDPNINCPSDAVVECTGNLGIETGDPQLGPFFAGVSAMDVCDPTLALSNNAPAFMPLGDTDVTFVAEDDSGNIDACVATVDVQDTIPPTIDVVLDRTSLWAPNHRLVTIHATVEVADICDPDVEFVLTSITSNEPADAPGSGSTGEDIVGAELGTPDLEFELRSERQGGGDGRVYTIVYTATDVTGNSTPAIVEVRVDHDQSK